MAILHRSGYQGGVKVTYQDCKLKYYVVKKHNIKSAA